MEERHKIVLVDEDPLIVKATQLVLESVGHEVRPARSASEALALMRAERPDLVILDIMMDPSMDGECVSDVMLEDDQLRAIPVVMTSCVAPWHYPSHLPADRYSHAADFLVKPVQPSDLLESIRRSLG